MSVSLTLSQWQTHIHRVLTQSCSFGLEATKIGTAQPAELCELNPSSPRFNLMWLAGSAPVFRGIYVMLEFSKGEIICSVLLLCYWVRICGACSSSQFRVEPSLLVRAPTTTQLDKLDTAFDASRRGWRCKLGTSIDSVCFESHDAFVLRDVQTSLHTLNRSLTYVHQKKVKFK